MENLKKDQNATVEDIDLMKNEFWKAFIELA